MSNERVRVTFEVTPEVNELLESLANEAGTTKVDIMRRAIAVMKAASEQKRRGRGHIGFVEDPTQLDAEIIGVL